MSSINLGRACMAARGTYSASETYAALDLVTYEGALYIAKKASTGVTPAEGEYWQYVAAKGAKGDTGAQGAKGDKGDDGEDGVALETDDSNPLAVLHDDGGYCGLFKTIACIGDSLTAGVHEHNEQGTWDGDAMADYSYPSFMARALGNTVYNWSVGGFSATQLLPRIVTEGWLSAHPCDAYIIALGTNDVKDKEVVTGSNDDIDLADMTNTDATTDIGAYGKIIQLIRAQVPKAKIFMVGMNYSRNTASQVTQSNVKYASLAEYMGCYFLDMGQYGVTSAKKSAWNAVYMCGGHYNTLGYKLFSVWVMSYIDWIIRKNMSAFGQIAFTQTDYVYITVSYSVQPQNVTVTAGAITESLSATAVASNGGDVAYQWYSNTAASTGGTAISGATGATMALDTALSVGTYYYYCYATCSGNGRASNVVTVTVEGVSVSVTTQPSDMAATVGEIVGSLTAAAASDSSAVTYQWYSNTTDSSAGGTLISGATDATMAIDTTLTAGTYYYYCVATSLTAGTATSRAATVTVSAASETTYLASYTLCGTASAATGTLTDESEHGNAIVPSGGVTNDASGYPLVDAAGEKLTVAPCGLDGHGSYTIHMRWVSENDLPNNGRLFMLSTVFDARLITNSAGVSLAIQQNGTELFTFNEAAYTLQGLARYQDMRDLTVDLTVVSDSVTMYVSGTNETNNSAEFTRPLGTITGFTDAVEAGIVLGNKTTGDRPLGAALREFAISLPAE